MKYIDVHAHMNFAIYADDLNEVVQRAFEDGVMVMNVGTQQGTSQKACDLAREHKHLYAIVGLHPIHTTARYYDHNELGEQGEEFISRGEVFDKAFYRKLIRSSKKVLAMGECGLDYYHGDDASKEKQEIAFRAQIELAIEENLPLMLHVRPSENSYDAYEDVLAILKEYKKDYPQLIGDVHFFVGSVEVAQKFLDLGFYISFTGVITFARMYEELVASIPLDRILSETDAPYVSPVPFRGKRNEPSHVREVVKKIAEIKGISEEELAKQIMQNAKKLFKIE